jgi:hypothetical protein
VGLSENDSPALPSCRPAPNPRQMHHSAIYRGPEKVSFATVRRLTAVAGVGFEPSPPAQPTEAAKVEKTGRSRLSSNCCALLHPAWVVRNALRQFGPSAGEAVVFDVPGSVHPAYPSRGSRLQDSAPTRKQPFFTGSEASQGDQSAQGANLRPPLEVSDDAASSAIQRTHLAGNPKSQSPGILLFGL